MDYHISLTEGLGILSVILLITGFVKFIIYYKFFNIPIIEYIEPTEIITLFADNIATAAGAILLLILPYIKILLSLILSNTINSILTVINEWSVPILSFLLITEIMILMIILLFKSNKIEIFELTSYSVIIPIIITIIPLFIIFVNSYSNISLSNGILIVISLSISFFAMILLATINEIVKVKKYGYYSKIIVRFENEIISSTNNFYYVGKTKNFVFFYSSHEQSSTVYSSKNLKSITYNFSKNRRLKWLPDWF